MKLERTLLDKFVSGAFLDKRHIGRPLKYNIRSRGRQGWVELVFNPRNNFEQFVSKALRFIHPYLSFVTYRFHVEKAREAGIRIEDFYMNKFHKEPYIQFHVFAQYFHPETLLERVRDVNFYRRPRTLFKGFKVPDWATAEQRHGWELDTYSRAAWDNAMHDLNSEWTPMQFAGERLEPSPLSWFRLEQYGKGTSSRLFYNEVPNPRWIRHGGHYDQPEKYVESFTYGDQELPLAFGMDTSTPEGREAFKKEWDAICEMAPELLSKDDLVYPNEQAKELPTEPHFRRVWQFYREHMFRLRYAYLVEQGEITADEAENFQNFIDYANIPSFNVFLLAKLGQLEHLHDDPGYQATVKVLDRMGLGRISIDTHTSNPYELQFWEQFDILMELNEQEMIKELPSFVTDPNNRARVEALLAGRKREAVGLEETRQLPL